MKKYLLSSLLVLFCFNAFSQTEKIPTPANIRKAKLSEVTFIQELITDIPKDLVMFNSDVVGKISGVTVSVNDQDKLDKQDGSFCLETINLLKNVELGTKIYFDVKYRALGSQLIYSKTVAFKVIE